MKSPIRSVCDADLERGHIAELYLVMTMGATVDASRGLACKIAYILQCDKDTAFPKGKTRLELRGQPVLGGSSLKGELLPSLR